MPLNSLYYLYVYAFNPPIWPVSRVGTKCHLHNIANSYQICELAKLAFGREYWLKGRLSTVHLLIQVACFVNTANNVCIIRSSWSKLVCARRSTVLSLSLQWEILVFGFHLFWLVCLSKYWNSLSNYSIGILVFSKMVNNQCLWPKVNIGRGLTANWGRGLNVAES